ncbi:VanZ family protein [Arcticibacter sp. MXS-1]|uniref:VanZ family protein n=1 Tax=Arcticibacter sp. MXS-1 TaxID=3341726 RepID=UPI0035A923B1
MTNILKYQYPAILWGILVLVLCDIPMGDPSGGSMFFEGFDKLVHLGFFFVLTVFLLFGKLRQQRGASLRIPYILKVLLVSVAFGGLIELLQWKVFTYRSADWWDFFCDAAGVCMAVFSYIFLHRTGYEKSI